VVYFRPVAKNWFASGAGSAEEEKREKERKVEPVNGCRRKAEEGAVGSLLPILKIEDFEKKPFGIF
jgi:hypothetical protein